MPHASRPGMLAARGRSSFLMLLAGLLGWLAAPPEVAAFERAAWEQAGWITEYEAGMARARAGGNPAFVYFDAAWCSWCQQYKRDTLGQRALRTLLARDFVRVAVDSDARPDLMRRFDGKGLPFTLVLAPDGGVLARFVGVMRPQDLAAMLGTLARQPTALVARHAPDAVLHRVASLDHPGYAAFRAAYLQHLESLYEPTRAALSGRFETGTSHKRTSVLAWLYLMEQGLWGERAVQAARAERRRLWDPLDTGFFNFVDPGRDDYLESSKLLEANAWMAAWQAQVGLHDPEARQTAQLTRFYLREVLWDRARGGFFQAQVADNAYYAMTPTERLRHPAPPLDRAKRADTHAQTAWALTRVGRYGGDERATDDAARALDFVLGSLWRDGRLYHLWRDGQLSAPDQPHDWFWVLAAGAEVERARPDRDRRARLDAIADRAGRWLAQRMRGTPVLPLDNELAGLIAWVAGQPAMQSRLPAGARDWALRQLRIEAETPPDELVIGLWAWQARLPGRPAGQTMSR